MVHLEKIVDLDDVLKNGIIFIKQSFGPTFCDNSMEKFANSFERSSGNSFLLLRSHSVLKVD